jgi:hypothetical protein
MSRNLPMINKKFFMVVFLLFADFAYVMEEKLDDVNFDEITEQEPSNNNSGNKIMVDDVFGLLVAYYLEDKDVLVLFTINKEWSRAAFLGLSNKYTAKVSFLVKTFENYPEKINIADILRFNQMMHPNDAKNLKNPAIINYLKTRTNIDNLMMSSLSELRGIYKLFIPSKRIDFSKDYLNKNMNNFLRNSNNDQEEFPKDYVNMPQLMALLIIQPTLKMQLDFPDDKAGFYLLFKNRIELETIVLMSFDSSTNDKQYDNTVYKIGEELSHRGLHNRIPSFRQEARKAKSITARNYLEILCQGWFSYFKPTTDLVKIITKEMLAAKTLKEGEKLDPEIRAFVAFAYYQKKQYKEAIDIYKDLKEDKKTVFHDTYYYVSSKRDQLAREIAELIVEEKFPNAHEQLNLFDMVQNQIQIVKKLKNEENSITW